MAERAKGSATLVLGLLTLPVKLFTAVSDSEFSFNQINPVTGSRVKQQLVDAETGEVLDRKSLVKGYEYTKGHYVLFASDELEGASNDAAIQLDKFVPLMEVDPIYYQDTSYLLPDKGGAPSYSLLWTALVQEGLLGVGKHFARGKEHLVGLRAASEGLVLHTLSFPRQIRPWPSGGPPLSSPDIKLVGLARQLIQMNRGSIVDLADFVNDTEARMLSVIEAKVNGAPAPVAPTPQASAPLDLMAALQASLKQG